MALSRIFDIAQRSLGTYRRALDVTSHNIANASNPNYSRQRANFATETPEINAGMIWGTGVRLESIERIRNQLTESQILNNNPKFSFNDKSSYLVGQVENIFSEPSELGLSSLIDDFMNSWSQLSSSPNSIPLRNNVIYSAQKMGAKVNSINENFDIIKSDIVAEFKSTITQINDYIDQIKNLNTKIFETGGSGVSPNDFLDERDRLINELSKLTNINVTYNDKNIATVSIGGVFAADGTTSVKFEAFEKEGELFLRSQNSMNLAALTGGEMYALKDVYSNKIPSYKEQLDNVVHAIKSKVNQLHSSGFSIEDPPLPGENFFDEDHEDRLVVNSTILNDPYKIAVSKDGSSGNGDIALSIYEISNKKIINNLSISEAYSTLISGIGNHKQSADNMTATDKLVLEQLELQKASYSGVSIDEEMANVIKFQRSYDASAKLIRVADEMLDTLINMV